MKIFVLSLASSEDRRTVVTTTMKKYGLDFEFIDGVDGRIHTEHPYVKRYDKEGFTYNHRRLAAPGELGCYASHMLLWDKCIELNQPVLVLEDDFILKPNIKKAMEIAEQLIDDAGFIRMEVTKRKPMFKVRKVGKYTLNHFLKVPQCTTCYMISPSASRAFLDSSKKIVQPVDVMIRNVWMHQQPIYGLSPYAVTGGVHKSIIGERKKMSNRGIVTTLICMLTRLKNKIFNALQQAKFIYYHYF